MFRKLFLRCGSSATPPSPVRTEPHAAAATEVWIKSNEPVEQDQAQESISEQISLSESERNILKRRGELTRVIRRQKAQLFHAERGSHDSKYSTMTDQEAEERCSNAAVWAEDLRSDPMYLEDDVRNSLSPPDWAVSTALEAMHGRYKPAMFDWLEYEAATATPSRPQRPQLKSYEEGDFVGWCESLMNSVFGLTEKENDKLVGRFSTPLDDEDDEERKDFFVPLQCDEEEMEKDEEGDDDFDYRVGTFVSQHRGFTCHQAPLVGESVAVIRRVSGGVVPHQQAEMRVS